MEIDHSIGLIQNINSTDGLIAIGGTGGLQVPTGTTAQRPISAGFGTLRINSTLSALEYYNNSTWMSIGSGVSSVALTMPSIFTVTGSPITTAGTLAATFTSQPANTSFVAPAGSSGVPSFRTVSMAQGDLSDVVITTPASSQTLTYNGTKWVNSNISTSSVSGILSTWTSIGGSPARYTASFSHNLGTMSVIVSLFDSVTNQMVIPDKLQLTGVNTILVTVASNTRSLRIVVIANGQSIAAGGAVASSVIVQNSSIPLTGSYTTLNFIGGGITATNAGANITNISVPTPVLNAGGAVSLQEDLLINRPTASIAGRLFLATDSNILFRDTGVTWVPLTNNAIRTLTYVAASLDTPNSSDWVVNALAPSVSDTSYTSMSVRSFDQTAELGVGLLITPPATATTVTFTFKGRAAIAPGVTSVVQPRVYRRQFPSGSAPGGWGAAIELANITIPTNAFYVYSSQTLSLTTLGWTPGQLTLLEITRRTSGVVGTNLPSAFYLAELMLEFN